MIVDILKKSRVALCRILEGALILAVFVLVIDVLWGVLTRWSGTFVVWLIEAKGIVPWSFLPTGQSEYSEELARFLLIWISLLGGAVAFGEKAHLGVDYFVGKFDAASQKLLAIFAQLVVLFFAVSIFIIGGSRVVLDTLEMQQITPALGIQQGYVYLALPIAGAFMVTFTVERILELVLSKKQEGVG